MTETTDLDSGWATGVSAPVGKFRDFGAAIGEREETAAVTATGRVSATALLKGVCAGLGLSVGGGAQTDTTPRFIENPVAAIGAKTDAAAATASTTASVPSILKGLLAGTGV